MTQTAINSDDLTLLRSNYHTIDDIRFNIFKPDIVTTLTVSSTPTSNPASELSVSGTLTDVEIGQRFIIRDTNGKTVTHGTVRLAPSGSTLYISPVSLGDRGYVANDGIHRAITVNDTITVYKDRPLWGDYSRIVGSSGANAFRKLWTVSYTDQNEDTPPISNCGTSQSDRVSVGNTASFTLPRSGSNSSYAIGSKTISSYAWNLPTGVTLKAGYALSDSVIEVDAVAGQHVIDLTVTDSNSKTHTSHCYLFVSDGSTYVELFDRFSTRIESDSQDWNGRSITFTVTGSNIRDDILPASYVHLQHDSLYNGTALSNGVDVDVFVGYVADFRYSHNGDYGQVTITAVSPYIYLQRVFMPSQLITEVNNPNNWTQVTSDLSNPAGALQYIRWHCQNLFSMHDIDTGSLTTPRKLSYEYNSTTIAGGLDISAQAILGNVGSASDGTLVLRRNPNFEDNTFRNALAVGMTFSTTDIVPPLEYPLTVPPPYADVRSGAFIYNGSNVNGFYGVKRWGQGTSETVLPNFTVTASEGLDGVVERVGHLYVDQNTTDEQAITTNRNINVVDPVYMIWYRCNFDSEFDPSGNDVWDNARILPRRVNRTWNNNKLTLTTQVQFKRETFGQQADEWVIGSGTTVITGGWVAGLGQLYTPNTDQLGLLPNIAIVVNTSGQGAITQNFTDLSPSWNSLNGFVSGTICDVAYDYNSPFITNGYLLNDPFGLYILSASGTTLYIYRVFDIKAGTLQVDLITTYTMNDSSTTTSARIACSPDTGTLVIVAWHDQTGVLFGRSTDGGSTWSSSTRVGDSITDTDNDNAEIGLYVSGTNQAVTAPNSSGEYGTYLATTAGGSFSKLSNSEDNTAPQPMITGDGNTTLYVSTDNDGTGSSEPPSDYAVTFDDVSDATYTVGGQGTTINATGSGNGGGNSAYCERTATTSDSLQFELLVSVDVSETAITTVDIEFDVYMDLDMSSDPLIGSSATQQIYTHVELFDGGSSVDGVSTLYDTDTKNTGLTFSFTENQTWNTISESFTFSSSDVNSVDFWVGLGTKYPLSSTFHNDIDSTSFFKIDNIKIYIGGKPSPSAVDPKLYKVTTYTATDSWTDVTPATDYIPQLPYGLGVDIADTDNIELTSTDDTTPKWFSSSNAGTGYTDNGASDFRVIKRVGNILFSGGDDNIGVSVDAGTTFEDKRGNIDTVMNGGIGTIKQLLVFV